MNEFETVAGDSSCVCVMMGTTGDVSLVFDGVWNSVTGWWGDLSVMVMYLTS
jgi:hypothetical protein